jgi:hypothetical protein
MRTTRGQRPNRARKGARFASPCRACDQPLQRGDPSAGESLERELRSMARWAYYGLEDGFMRALLSDWENRGEE